MQYTFGRSDNRLEMENFDQPFHNASVKGSSMGPLTKQFPWIQPLLRSMPESLLSKLDPDMMTFLNLEHVSNGHLFDEIHCSPSFLSMFRALRSKYMAYKQDPIKTGSKSLTVQYSTRYLIASYHRVKSLQNDFVTMGS
jgi:hypothetical protein